MSDATTDDPSLEGHELSASFTVRSLDDSLAWYRDVLGCTVDRLHEREGALVAASLRAGSVRILLARDDGAKGMDREKGAGFSLMITTSQDADALADRVRRHDWPLETEPVDTPWGARVFRLKDPDGFKLVISSERGAAAV